MNIVLVGVGALGSHLVLFARNVEGSWTLVDFDRVEGKNVLSQFHTKMGMRQNKANALAKTMRGLFGIKTKPIPHKLTVGNVDTLLGTADLVIDCLDNGESRRVIQNYVREKDIACLHGALAPGGMFGRVVWDENFVIDDETGAGQATCEDGEHLPFIVQASTCLAESVKLFIKDGKKINWQISPAGTIRL